MTTDRHLLQVKRIYEPVTPAQDGDRMLVDRLWPRGLSKEAARLTMWLNTIAPSTALRQQYHQGLLTWEALQEAYTAELAEHRAVLDDIIDRLAERPVTLLYASRDVRHNHAVILKGVIDQRLAAR